MPEDGILGPINALGTSLIGGTANAWMEGRRNKQQREWALAMYNRQRADALSDWERQNMYNSPSAQMERLKAAGLNPNLVYGSGSTYSAGAVRGSNVPAYSPDKGGGGTPPYGTVGLSLDAYFNAQVKQAQIDNLKAQNDVIKQEAALKAFGVYKGETMLPLESKLAEISYDVKVNQISQMMNRWDIDKLTIEVLERTKEDRVQKVLEEVMLLAATRAKTKAEEERLKHAAHLLMQDEQLREFDIDLRSKGIHPGTPQWYRAIQIAWDTIMGRK